MLRTGRADVQPWNARAVARGCGHEQHEHWHCAEAVNPAASRLHDSLWHCAVRAFVLMTAGTGGVRAQCEDVVMRNAKESGRKAEFVFDGSEYATVRQHVSIVSRAGSMPHTAPMPGERVTS